MHHPKTTIKAGILDDPNTEQNVSPQTLMSIVDETVIFIFQSLPEVSSPVVLHGAVDGATNGVIRHW